DSAGGDFIRAGLVLTTTFLFSDGTRAQSTTTISGAAPQPTTTSSSTTTTTQGVATGPQFISGSAPTDYSTNAGEYVLNCTYDRPLGCVYAQSGGEGCRYITTSGGTHSFGCSTRTLGLKENKCGLSSYILQSCPNQINVVGTTLIF
ncbi:MAG: hypothetical protein K2X47_14370, partial [Bdellovibrionales bacterium]|nr:hypothetical protein [Bdellovibrionales bacterium]